MSGAYADIFINTDKFLAKKGHYLHFTGGDSLQRVENSLETTQQGLSPGLGLVRKGLAELKQGSLFHPCPPPSLAQGSPGKGQACCCQRPSCSRRTGRACLEPNGPPGLRSGRLKGQGWGSPGQLGLGLRASLEHAQQCLPLAGKGIP